jgi:GYF domain 2
MSDGWFYKQDGQAVGPVSTAALRELLAVGQVRPDQPVWRRDGPNLTFVRALAATDSSAQLPDRLRRFDGHPERAGSRPKEEGGCISKGA